MKKQGFTIIETLVAITILLISIAGPLTIAEKGLTNAVSSQDRMVASYLAQDLMEYVKNVRDDNLLANGGSSALWLNGLSGCTSGEIPCDFDTVNGNPSSPLLSSCTGTSQNLCRVYVSNPNGGYYTPTPGGTPTKFSRAFTVTIPGGGSAGAATSALVTVTVAWSTGTIAEQVVIQDILFNTSR